MNVTNNSDLYKVQRLNVTWQRARNTVQSSHLTINEYENDLWPDSVDVIIIL